MKLQNQAILSIGTNQGNRLENLTQCIALIHQEIATVISVSKCYETPSWGFESDAFYNIALIINTQKSASELLKTLLEGEKKLGRIRNEQMGYQSRIIDIDIVSFNNEIVTTDELQLPHPQMQNRLFVLLPMNDLGLNYFHPILNKNISELIQECEDESDCKIVADLELPIKRLKLQNLNYLIIEGNIGAGKTSLATKISEDFNSKLLLERFADNSFLPKFYLDRERYSFPLEVTFLTDRYQQLTDDLSQYNLVNDLVVADYHVFKSLIFAKITLHEDEFQLYQKLFDIIYKEIPKPNLYVYLYRNTSNLLENIKKRGRIYEQEIESDYLNKISKGYLDYIQTKSNLDIVMIDVTNRDFINNQEDYIFVLEEIQKKLV